MMAIGEAYGEMGTNLRLMILNLTLLAMGEKEGLEVWDMAGARLEDWRWKGRALARDWSKGREGLVLIDTSCGLLYGRDHNLDLVRWETGGVFTHLGRAGKHTGIWEGG